MSIKSITVATGMAALIATTMPSAALAATDGTKDVKTRSGSCDGRSEYTYRLADAGDDLNRLRVNFKVDSNREDKTWDVRIYRNGNKVYDDSKQTGSAGNVTFKKSFVGDDDAKIRVVADVGYGEECRHTMKLDTPS